MTISWEYDPNTTVLSVEEYERMRPVRRTQSQMILPRSVRVDMLRKEWGISNREIVSAVRSGVRAKNQRRTTLTNLGRTEKVEEFFEGATKQLLKTLFLRKGTSQKAFELEQEIQKVDDQRAQLMLEHSIEDEYDDYEASESESPWVCDAVDDDLEQAQSAVRDIDLGNYGMDDIGSHIQVEKPQSFGEEIEFNPYAASEPAIQSRNGQRIKKPVITGEEPDDDDLCEMKSIRSAKSNASTIVDC